MTLADQLHSYMTFRAKKEGVNYGLDPSWFEMHLRAGVYLFFGVATDDQEIIRDKQNPKALAEWRKQTGPSNTKTRGSATYAKR
jgi:hypothetical protein